MSDSSGSSSRRWWLRGTLGLLIVVLILAGALVGVDVSMRQKGERMVREAVADLDRDEPGWRLADLEAARPTPPPERDGGICVREAARLLPQPWPSKGFPETISELGPAHRLRDDQEEALRAELARASAALTQARKIVDRPEGRFHVEWTPDYVSTLLPHVHEARSVAELLRLEAMQRAQAGDGPGAFAACRAALNLSRIIGDEPNSISQLVRVAVRAVACSATERTLAQTPAPPAGDLAALQNALRADEAQKWFLVFCRAELAGQHVMWEAAASGKVKWSDLEGRSGSDDSFEESFDRRYRLRQEQALILNTLRQLLPIARGPVEDQDRRAAPVYAAARSSAPKGRLFPPIDKFQAACTRSHAQARCMIVLLAVERYRLAHGGKWPAALTDLSPDLLPAIPADPYDGAPLRYRKSADGVVVYSVGTNRIDDGGDLSRPAGANDPLDLGYRLWNVDQRRQTPPLPKPKPVEGPDGGPPGAGVD